MPMWAGCVPRAAAACGGARFPLSSLLVLHKSCEWLNILPGQGRQRVSAQQTPVSVGLLWLRAPNLLWERKQQSSR